MCLIVFAYRSHPDYKLILTANRDEFYDRPTVAAHWWDDYPDILGGRDLKAKGTWMGLDKKGRFAAVTNYRDLSNIKEDAKSRGDLPVEFLLDSNSASEYSEQVMSKGNLYNGFNLLAMDKEMIHCSNYGAKVNTLKPGIYGLSNALLNTPWPKVEQAKKQFEEQIQNPFSLDELIRLMQNSDVASDDQLPQTGLPLEMERAVSAMCIRTPDYGTCCSTAITIDNDDKVEFLEISYPVGNRTDQAVTYSFKIEQ